MREIFIVTMRDGRGEVVHCYAVCTKHAAEDNHAKHALATGSYNGDGVTVRRARPDTAITCDECNPIDI